MTAKQLIQKYLRQGLTKDERFDLEKKALDDDFLDAAWEGYQLHQKGDKHEVIPILENRLAQATTPVQKGRVASFRKYWPMVAAASVALLLGANFLFNNNSTEFSASGTDTMAVVLEEGESDDLEFSAVDVTTSEVQKEIKDVEETRIETPNTEPKLAKNQVPVTDLFVSDQLASVETSKAVTIEDGDSQGSNLITGAPRGENTFAASDLLPSSITIDEVQEINEEDAVTPSHAEVVIALDENPESILSLNTEIEDGKSSIKKKESIVTNNGKLLNKRLKLDNDSDVLSAKEVDKVPNYAKRIQISSETPDTAMASPSMGWKAFQKYLDDNARFDKDFLFMRGYKELDVVTVPVIFDLDEYNKPANISIRGKQSYDDIDKEAIRVLMGSGTWSTLQLDKPISIDLKITLKVKE